MNETIYVMPEPMVEIENGQFRFTGEAKEVKPEGNVLDYLKAADAYNSEADVYGSVLFDDDFSIKERLEEVDELLAIIDKKRLKKDLDKKGYAFLMGKRKLGKFEDYKNKKYIANTDRIIQDLVYQKIPKEFKLDFNVRHFKLQEAVELMLSDKAYKKVMNDYWQYNLEVIQTLISQSVSGYKLVEGKFDVVEIDSEVLTPKKIASVWSLWYGNEGCFDADADWPSGRDSAGVAALKKIEPKKVA